MAGERGGGESDGGRERRGSIGRDGEGGGTVRGKAVKHDSWVDLRVGRDVQLRPRALEFRPRWEGAWGRAADSFTRAIEASSNLPVLLTNRALCNQKLERWELVERDARAAIEQPDGSVSVKAHYLLGKALLEQGRFQQSKDSLLRAMSLSSSPDFKSYRLSIDAALYFVKKRMAEELRKQAREEQEEIRLSWLDLARRCCDERIEQEGSRRGQALEQRREREGAVEGLLGSLLSREERRTAPSGIVCRLSRRIMLDPVCTPSGETYERSAIERFLQENEGREPGGSRKVSSELLVPNVALKAFIDGFLAENPLLYDMGGG
eukprot:759257-Hanusia_phi.AAC.1